MSENIPSTRTVPEEVIVKFFAGINNKNFAAAFDCLTPKFKQRWENNLARFAEGYLYTNHISTPLTVVESDDGHNAAVHVYYHDNIDALNHPLLTPLQDATLGDLDNVIRNLQAYRKLLLEDLSADPAATDAIKLNIFFAKNSGENTLWLSKADRSRDEELFTREGEAFQMYRKALCVKTEDGYLIDDLVHG